MPVVKSANLCWGQHHHLLRYLRVPAPSRHEAHIGTSYPLPAGCTVAAVRAALTHLVRRHEVLRTVYDLTGTAADGRAWPRQLVQPPAPQPVVEATTEDAVAVIARLTRTPFDLAREWPLRACVVTSGGRLVRLHLVFNHLAFDDVALDRLAAELDELLAARTEGRPAVLDPVDHQPVDLARFEESRTDADVEPALSHWRDIVEKLPADVFSKRRKASDAAHSASYTVPTLLSAARAIAAREHVWPSAVHLAAYAVTLAAYTGETLVAHRMYTSQRDASGFGGAVTCLSYPTPVLADLDGDPLFSTVVKESAVRVSQAMTHAHVPYDRVYELVAEAGVRVAAELNFLDNAPRSCRTKRDRYAVNAAPADWAHAGSDSYLRVYEWADGITLALQALDAVMDADAVEQFLRGYARLVEAHRDPGADLRVSEAAALIGFAPPEPPRIGARAPERTGAAPAERVLADVVAEVNGLEDVDPARSYLGAGGRVLRLPRVVEALHERGWSVALVPFTTTRPLSALAHDLVPARG
ncbi:Condensation domain-containing protein [Amycolatopsis tolypomycina]|uniref:Condensation domain-containing protein n=1 Tax=Amycolatopsis tolypomycina TaxID=208445 RepID=A0A1H4TPJ8_9PSEU|nr:condensation domain-containing protein [Amycolatopsis tolypomycina]SEC58200.1 Condensation domain-containing protein [Amycolatopsis tolypomycina]